MRRVAVVGATGYSGGELCALLARHPRVELAAAFSGASGLKAPLSSVHPSLAGWKDPWVLPFSLEALFGSGAEMVFLATPNETSAELVPPLLEKGLPVIDLSGAYRLKDPAAYPAWYGFTHPAPHLLAGAVYGLTEWCDLQGARLVANPGCYPTSVLLALKPILDLLKPGAPVVCDAKSGVSGAGKRSELAFSFSELANNFKAYGAKGHRHEPEMRAELGFSEEADFVFVPHLLPLVRGILSTIHVSFGRPLEPEELSAAYQKQYGGSPIVRLHPAGSLPDLKDVVGTPRCDIGFVLRAGGRRAVIVSVIDNLLKGAASQALQNMNGMYGFPDQEGL